MILPLSWPSTHFSGVPVGGEEEEAAFVTAFSAPAVEAPIPSSARDGGGGGTAVVAAAVAGCGGGAC